MEDKRDQGLLRALGPWSLAAAIFSMIVGAGVFTAPAAMARALGAWAPLAIIGCALAVGAVAVCCAEGCSRVPTSGGIYGCVEAAFGPLAGFICGMLLLAGDLLACGGITAALASAAASLGPAAWFPMVRVAVIITVLGSLALINSRGVKRGAQFVTLSTVLKLLPLLVFIVAGLGAMHASNLRPVPVELPAIGRAVLLSLFTFMGMEGALLVSGEVRDPSRVIPRGLALALGSVTALYVLIQIVAQGVLGGALGRTATPLSDVMASISPGLRVLLLAGAALSMLGWLGSDVMATPRILFAISRDGRLPALLGRVNPKTHAPNTAILIYTVAGVLLAITGTFAELAVLSALASTVLYIYMCLAARRLQQRGTALAGAPLNFRWLQAAAVIGVVSMIVLIALASAAEILGLALMVALSAVLYLAQARVRLTRNNA